MIPEKFNPVAAAGSAHTIDVMSNDKGNNGGGRGNISQQMVEDMKEEM